MAVFGYKFQGDRHHNGNVFFSIKPLEDSELPEHLRRKKETDLEWKLKHYRQGIPEAALSEESNGDNALNIGAGVMDPGELRKIFELYDVERKGYLTVDQVREIYSRLDDYGLDTADQAIESALRNTCSKDSARYSNKITRDQFAILMLYFMRTS
jgi:hypothetical protein